jgi:hypothetical protein
MSTVRHTFGPRQQYTSWGFSELVRKHHLVGSMRLRDARTAVLNHRPHGFYREADWASTFVWSASTAYRPTHRHQHSDQVSRDRCRPDVSP